MFVMDNSVISGFHKYLDKFARRRLSKTRGDNVTNITAQLVTVSELIFEEKYLPHETSSNVFTGMTKCSVSELKGNVVIGYMIFYTTRVLYDYTRLS